LLPLAGTIYIVFGLTTSKTVTLTGRFQKKAGRVKVEKPGNFSNLNERY
jgi:hypothetical protein